MRWAGPVTHTGGTINAYGIFVGKPEEKLSPWRPMRRWEDNIKINLAEIVCESLDWIHMAHDRD